MPVLAEDLRLVQSCLADDPKGIACLVERFESDIFSICYRILNHRQDAEDVTQEIFLRIFRSLSKWDGLRPLKPWIMKIAVNRCRTALSQKSKRPESADYLEVIPGKSEEGPSKELVQEIKEFLSTTRSEAQLVFTLFHEEDYSYEEIAEIMERPMGTIKTWLHRTRAEMLNYLQKKGLLENTIYEVSKNNGIS